MRIAAPPLATPHIGGSLDVNNLKTYKPTHVILGVPHVDVTIVAPPTPPPAPLALAAHLPDGLQPGAAALLPWPLLPLGLPRDAGYGT